MIISPPMNWRPRLNPKQLKQANDLLSSALIRTREALEIGERRRAGLEIILAARLNRIGNLNDKLERLRAQNRALDGECERLAEMVRLAPAANAVTPAPK
jgi:hypothetical protein